MIILILVGVVLAVSLMALQYFLLWYITKDLNEKEKEQYYEDVYRRTCDSMAKDTNGIGGFSDFI